MNREDIELYVMGEADDAAAIEAAIARDPALAQLAGDEARFEGLLREAAAGATFCAACAELVRGERCDACGAAVRPGGYVVERVVVANAHGRMYVARDADGRRVALKELAFVNAPEPAVLAAFEREAKFLRALEHPAIPRFVASFEEGRGVHARYYLAQELVDGTPLDRLDDHWYTEPEIVALARDVLQVLVYLQALSPMVIHRDLKPANMIRRADGSIALVDFGAAHVQGATAGSTTMGTFGYMPVEQLAGVVDATTDGYALGASLVHLLTRQEPWKLTQQRATINASAPLRGFLDRLTAAEPSARFAGAKDALAALDQLGNAPAKPRASLGARVPWRKLGYAAAGCALAAAGGGGVYALTAGHERPGSDVDAAALARAPIGSLRIHLPKGSWASLYVDNNFGGFVREDELVAMVAGNRQIDLQNNEFECQRRIGIDPGKTTNFFCSVERSASDHKMFAIDARLPTIDVAMDQVHFADAMFTLFDACHTGVVISDELDSLVTLQLKGVHCHDVINELLQSRGLGVHQRHPDLYRIETIKQIDAEYARDWDRDDARDALGPSGRRGVQLLPSPDQLVDMRAKHGRLRDYVQEIVKRAGVHVNVIVPDDVDAWLSVDVKGARWGELLDTILAAEGLGYRYDPQTTILRVATLKDLDAEDRAELERRKRQ